jgi:hypothetical protein
MRVFARVAAVLTCVAAVGALALPTVAAASSAQPHQAVYTVQQVNPTTYTNVLSNKVPEIPMRAGSWIIRTRVALGNNFLELTSEGNGLDMQVHATGFSTFNRSQPTGAIGWIFKTASNGYCVHGTNDNLVIATSSNCGANNTASQWSDDGNGRLQNGAYGNYLGINTLQEGVVARLEPTTGAYYMTYQNIG